MPFLCAAARSKSFTKGVTDKQLRNRPVLLKEDDQQQSPTKRSVEIITKADDSGTSAVKEDHKAAGTAAAPAPSTPRKHAAVTPSPLSSHLPPIEDNQSASSPSSRDKAAQERRSYHVSLTWNLNVTTACPRELSAGREYGWTLDSFDIGDEPIGHGKASQVFEARCKHTGFLFALKEYQKDRLSRTTMNQVRREIRIHSTLSHPNVINLYASFEDNNSVYLVLEHAARGDVFNWLQHKVEGARLADEGFAVRTVLLPALRAVAYLHERGIIHRDIKPENMLIDGKGVVKLADFGLSLDTEVERPRTRLGTLDYMAPEVLLVPEKRHSTGDLVALNTKPGTALYDGMCDVWALGVLTFEVLVGAAPFEDKSPEAKSQRIVASPLKTPRFLSSGSVDFIKHALIKDPAQRITLDEMFRHHFIRGNQEIRYPGSSAEMRRQVAINRANVRKLIGPHGDSPEPQSPSSNKPGGKAAPSSPNAVHSFPASPQGSSAESSPECSPSRVAVRITPPKLVETVASPRGSRNLRIFRKLLFV